MTATADEAAWRALVARSLAGRDPGALVRRTEDGLEVQAIYPPDPSGAALPRAANPESAWDIRETVAHADPAEANRRILDALGGGATSVLVAASAATLPAALDGVVLEAAGVALDAGFDGPAAAEALAGIAKGSPRARLAFHLDPLSALAVTGEPIAGRVEEAAAVAARWRSTYPEAGLFLATGRAVHEAGGAPAQELAMMAAAAVAYARAMVAAGLSMEEALGGLVLGLSLDTAPMAGVAKLRAARLIWAQIAGACGVAAPAKIEARTSRRMLARRDPWSNLLRLSCAAFAGAVGGADALVVEPYDQPLGTDDARARRLARNCQLILMDEAHVGRVQDPAAGAGAIEAHSRALAEAAWSLFRTIEAMGGLADALESGWVAGQVATARAAHEAAIAAGEAPLLGVTLHPGAPVEFAAASAPSSAPLSPVRWAAPYEAGP